MRDCADSCLYLLAIRWFAVSGGIHDHDISGNVRKIQMAKQRHSKRESRRPSGSEDHSVGDGLPDAFQPQQSPAGSPWIRRLISLAVVVHLIAVFGPPLAFQTRGPVGESPSVQTLVSPLRAYSEFLYLDRGYAFFAPDPGPSHLIRVAQTDSDGKVTESLIPDRRDQWPRLMYHRHFMLTEFLNEIYEPQISATEQAEAPAEELAIRRRARNRYEAVRKSYLDHLRRVHQDDTLTFEQVEHAMLGFTEMIDEPMDLDDPRLYFVMQDLPPVVDTPNSPRPPYLLPETLPPTGGPLLQPGRGPLLSPEVSR